MANQLVTNTTVIFLIIANGESAIRIFDWLLQCVYDVKMSRFKTTLTEEKLLKDPGSGSGYENESRVR